MTVDAMRAARSPIVLLLAAVLFINYVDRGTMAGPRASGRWVDVQNSVGALAGVIAPWLTGVIIQSTGHFTDAFVAAAAVSVFGLVGWIWMLPPLAELRWCRPAAVEP